MKILLAILVLTFVAIVLGAFVHWIIEQWLDRRERKRQQRQQELDQGERMLELERARLQLDMDKSFQDRLNSPIKQKDTLQ